MLLSELNMPQGSGHGVAARPGGTQCVPGESTRQRRSSDRFHKACPPPRPYYALPPRDAGACG